MGDLKKILIKVLKAVASVVLTLVVAWVSFVATLVVVLTNDNGNMYSWFILFGAIIVVFAIVGTLYGFIKKKAVYIPLLCAFGVLAVAFLAVFGYQSYLDGIPTVGESSNLLGVYEPYAENSRAVTLDEESELKFTEKLPVMDGATALYPIYASFAKAVFPESLFDYPEDAFYREYRDYLKCTTTTQAYRNIVTGNADIIFAALPSREQEEFARENGVELVYTPIGREAFVFFVNAKNPINDISLSEIQGIYSGEITKWEELGVDGFGAIKAFQRDKGSGSQSTLEKLMAGKNLMTPPREDVVDGMGGIIEQTADYKNFKNAIGYSFRFYSTEMVQNNQIKLLSVNGVYPSIENIENGSYPIASYFYAVTRSDADENVLKLLEWITGEQGQRIIEEVGYTPLEK